jgi:hypothetical protein
MRPYLIDCHDEAIALSMTLPATLDVSRQYSGLGSSVERSNVTMV